MSATVTPLPTAATPRKRPARSRYIRLFPERVFFVFARLSNAEAVAYLRVATEYVLTDGNLAADDRKLAIVAGVPMRQWLRLRAKLLELGFAEVHGDRWIDPDQKVNLEIQRQASANGRARALKRWHPAGS